MTIKRNRARGKQHQTNTAKALEGLNLGTLGEVDVLTNLFAIECKSRQKFVAIKWMDQAIKYAKKHKKIPLVVVHNKGKNYKNDLVILTMSDFVNIYNFLKGYDYGKQSEKN